VRDRHPLTLARAKPLARPSSTERRGGVAAGQVRAADRAGPRRRQGVFPGATPGGRLPASIRLGSVAESGDLSVVQFRATGVGVEDAVMQSVGGSRQSSPLQEVSATLAFLAATAELELFVALGSFDRQDAPLAPSVVATP
jgi:hypothetical protein